MSNDDKASYKGGPIIAVAVVAILAAYVGGYFFASEKVPNASRRHQSRIFASGWACAVYSPAARLEAVVLRLSIGLCYPNVAGEYLTYGCYDPSGWCDR